MPELPAGMRRHGRPVDPAFDAAEELYLRVRSEHVDNDLVLHAAIRLPVQSVNRQKYCDAPEWVLYPTYFGSGIAAFYRRDVPETLQSPGDVLYRFAVEHVPEEENYAHSEVRAYKEGMHVFNAKLEVNRQVKTQFRIRLAEAMRIIRRPDAV